MKWVVAADHGGVNLKAKIVEHLKSKGFEVDDLGGFDTQSKSDYPDHADRAVENLLSYQADYGVLVCGSGIGISMRANRYKGIRAALVHNEFTAESAKSHNDANIICFGDRVIDHQLALKCVDVFIRTEFEGGRHIPRLEKLDSPLVQKNEE